MIHHTSIVLVYSSPFNSNPLSPGPLSPLSVHIATSQATSIIIKVLCSSTTNSLSCNHWKLPWSSLLCCVPICGNIGCYRALPLYIILTIYRATQSSHSRIPSHFHLCSDVARVWLHSVSIPNHPTVQVLEH